MPREPKPPGSRFDREPIVIAGTTVPAGRKRSMQLAAARLPTQTQLSMPLVVVHGRYDGPRLWISAAIHGDELNGVEIIRRVLETVSPTTLHGTLVAVPIVNVFGFLEQSRYLPDRRDLNRSFPGSRRGSLAARLARLFMDEVVLESTHGIDLHTGSNHRQNLPQVRADLDNAATRQMAEAFGAPLTLHARMRDGSLRSAAAERGIPVLLYEAGQALRFERVPIATGVAGIRQVMGDLGMIEIAERTQSTSVISKRSSWVRARRSGLMRLEVRLGDTVRKGQRIGFIADALGEATVGVRAPFDGVVIGESRNPVVHQGDGIAHLAETEVE